MFTYDMKLRDESPIIKLISECLLCQISGSFFCKLYIECIYNFGCSQEGLIETESNEYRI